MYNFIIYVYLTIGGNGVYWPLVMLPVGIIVTLVDNTYLNWFAQIVGLAVAVCLGRNGKAWAWENKKWESFERFERVRHRWVLAALWLIVASVAFVALMFLIAI